MRRAMLDDRDVDRRPTLLATAQTEHQVEGRLLLDVVVGESTTILKLLASEDETLLIWRNAFLVLDLCFDVLDRVAGLHLQGDGLSGQRLDEDLHTAAQTKHEMQRRLFLNVIVAQRATIFQLLSGEDQTLLVWRDTFLVLNFRFDVLDGITRLDLERDSFARQRLDEYLHATSETQNQVERRFLLNVVIAESATVLELLAGEDETLLIWRDSFLVLDLGLNVFDRV